MPIIEWKTEYSVGIGVLDQQHKKLTSTVNDLYKTFESKDDAPLPPKIFKNLLEYVHLHFKTEEDLMIKYKYPDYEDHKKEHTYCTESILEFKKQIEDGKLVTMDLLNFLIDWVHDHVLEVDMKYSNFFHSKGLS